MQILSMACDLIPSKSFADYGVLCSSWIFMSSSKTKRTALNPMGLVNGRPYSRNVEESNIMVARVVPKLSLLMYLTDSRLR